MVINKITKEGQQFYDRPIYNTMRPRAEFVTPIARSVARAFKSQLPKVIVDLVGHERERLRWMKPDGKGGLVPRG